MRVTDEDIKYIDAQIKANQDKQKEMIAGRTEASRQRRTGEIGEQQYKDNMQFYNDSEARYIDNEKCLKSRRDELVEQQAQERSNNQSKTEDQNQERAR